MMYCLRAFLPLLLLPFPLAFSPIHLTTLLVLTYILNKPCPYCSLLLVILFASSCHWSGRCFWSTPSIIPNFDYSSSFSTAAANNTTTHVNLNWLPYFFPRLYTTPPTSTNTSSAATADDQLASFLLELTNSTISTLAGSAATGIANASSALLGKGTPNAISIPPSSAVGGVGTQWLRSLLGQGEWTVPCVGVKLVL